MAFLLPFFSNIGADWHVNDTIVRPQRWFARTKSTAWSAAIAQHSVVSLDYDLWHDLLYIYIYIIMIIVILLWKPWLDHCASVILIVSFFTCTGRSWNLQPLNSDRSPIADHRSPGQHFANDLFDGLGISCPMPEDQWIMKAWRMIRCEGCCCECLILALDWP